MTYIMEPYDQSLEYILKNGQKRKNRTGIDTYSVFGMQSRYKIDEHFPILTGRKMFYKSIFAELIWMLSGSTNINDLEKLGSKIWTAWRDPEFEKRNNLSDGDLGPAAYGGAMRAFGKRGDYQGFDQIEYMRNELKTNPQSRRILMNLWNAPEVVSDRIRLPPCHHNFQLFVDDEGRLSGMLGMRSNDYGCGTPANIQFYAALIYMFAADAELTPYELVYSTADTHIYENQIPMVEEYLARSKPDSPKMILNKKEDFYSYSKEDFEVIDYNPLPAIKVPVAV